MGDSLDLLSQETDEDRWSRDQEASGNIILNWVSEGKLLHSPRDHDGGVGKWKEGSGGEESGQ